MLPIVSYDLIAIISATPTRIPHALRAALHFATTGLLRNVPRTQARQTVLPPEASSGAEPSEENPQER